MTVDPVLALQSLGYTEREAMFSYLVAVHSGYFLRRQFDYFIDRQKGAIVQHFLEKARRAGHVEIIEYSQGWRVYHLFSRTIYRLLGVPESQNRRRKGDALIRARLMTLDYVLENDADHYLESGAEKRRYFSEIRGAIPEVFSGSEMRLHPLFDSFPISIADKDDPSSSRVRVVFVDEGMRTVEKFVRFLSTSEALLRALGVFELIYVSGSSFNFLAAEAVFRKVFGSIAPVQQQSLDTSWRQDSPVGLAKHFPPFNAQFTKLLFRYSYPKLRRNAGRVLSTVQSVQERDNDELLA